MNDARRSGLDLLVVSLEALNKFESAPLVYTISFPVRPGNKIPDNVSFKRLGDLSIEGLSHERQSNDGPVNRTQKIL